MIKESLGDFMQLYQLYDPVKLIRITLDSVENRRYLASRKEKDQLEVEGQ